MNYQLAMTHQLPRCGKFVTPSDMMIEPATKRARVDLKESIPWHTLPIDVAMKIYMMTLEATPSCIAIKLAGEWHENGVTFESKITSFRRNPSDGPCPVCYWVAPEPTTFRAKAVWMINIHHADIVVYNRSRVDVPYANQFCCMIIPDSESEAEDDF